MRGWWTAWALMLTASCGSGDDAGGSEADRDGASTSGGLETQEGGGGSEPDSQEWAEPPPDPIEDPLFVMEPKDFEAGKLDRRETKEVEFKFRNLSDTVCFVQRVDCSCKCLKLKAEENRVDPGQSVRVHGTLRAPGTQSFTSVRVRVFTNNERQRQVFGSVYFWRSPFLVAQPNQLDFSDCTLGEEVRRELKVEYSLPNMVDPLDLKPIFGGGLPVKVSGGEPVVIEEGERLIKVAHTWVFEVDTSKPCQKMEGVFDFQSDEHASLTIPVSLRVFEGTWYPEAKKIFMGISRPGEKTSRRFKVFFVETAEAPSVSVRTAVPGLTVKAEVVDGDKPHVLLTLDFQAPEEVGSVRGDVVLDASFAETPVVLPFGTRVRDR